MTNETFGKWMAQTLDPDNPASLRAASEATTKGIPEMAKALDAAASFKENADGRILLERHP